MNPEILLELAKRWEQDANPGGQTEAEDAAKAEYNRGCRETKRECADALRSLVQLLGR